MPAEQFKPEVAEQVANEIEEAINVLVALRNVAYRYKNSVTGETLANLILSTTQNEAHRLTACVKALRPGDDELNPLPHALEVTA
ncbi:MAG: hypothetical protein C3F19_09465 [Rhodocyclales bacterium]|nr:MAG: hypothetical protein C3F19_09465 [Rhodocyclales bacterium]